jgi:DNA-directed RNA polymerase specialized sigma subunit
MMATPTSDSFYCQFLLPLATRQASGESEQVLRDELLAIILPWVREQVRKNVRRIPTTADPSNVSSHMHEAAYQAVERLDWSQIQAWPMYLGTMIRRAAQQAARNDDYLSRQQRVLRKRFQLKCNEVEAKMQRQLLSSERDAIASDIATGRPDLIYFLLIGSHPQEFAEVPDLDCQESLIEDLIERRIARQKVQYWLEQELPPDVQQMVLDWLSQPRSKVLPQRLERKLQPYVMSLIKSIDGEEISECGERIRSGSHLVKV